MSVWSSSLANVQRPSPSNLPAAGQISSKAPEESWKKIDQMGPDADVFATNVESGRVDSYDQRVCRQHWHCLQVERQNLLQACRVAVKALVDRVCFAVVDDDCVELAQFMAVAENIFFHGYKGQESNSLLLGDDPDEDFWIVLRTGLTNSEAIKTVDNMGDVMTDLGKCRAWLRTCLVQKSLGTCYSQILNNQQLTRAYYSSSALFRREEGHLVFGLLQALDSVDFCLCLKDNTDLDLPVRTVVDYSYFIQFRASAVGNLADEGEWWNALEADAIPHVPRDSQSAKANAVVAAALSRPSRTSGDASSLDTTSEARDGGESAEAASTSEAGQPKPGEAQPKVAFSRAAPGVTTDIVGEEQTDGPSPPASSTLSPTARREPGAALNSLDGSNGVEMSDFIRLQHHVSREREQRVSSIDMLRL